MAKSLEFRGKMLKEVYHGLIHTDWEVQLKKSWHISKIVCVLESWENASIKALFDLQWFIKQAVVQSEGIISVQYDKLA